MDPDLLLIFGFITLIVFMAFGVGLTISKREHSHKERKLELEARLEEAKAAQRGAASADYSKFEERLRVLERIATDGNHNLALQIEQLRDLHEIDELTDKRERTQ